MAGQASELPLKGQVAFVTGATGGIGIATCLQLASLGCSVGIHFNTDRDMASQLLTQLNAKCGRAAGAQFHAISADMSNYDQVRNFYEGMVEQIGLPTILINNAGSTGGQSRVTSIEDVAIEDFERTWRINCGSAYLLTQLCIPAMEKKGWGRIIFVSSVAGITGGIIGPHYASSKSALHGMVHWIANAYAKKGITVNGVAPALIGNTKMLPGSSEELSQKIPIGRLGTPDEIADTIIWMVNTGYVTNKIIAVDGGMFPQ